MDKKEKEIQKYMASLDLTRKEAEQLWADDHSDEMTEEQTELEIKAKAMPRNYVGGGAKKQVKRERKIDSTKKELLDLFAQSIQSVGGQIVEIKTETELDFVFENHQYKVKLTKKRKPKEN